MKLFDVLLGRTKPAQPNLDHLFGLPGAQITLEASLGLRPTGAAGVCFKPAAGQQFAQTTSEVEQLLDLGEGVKVHEESDSYGYRWIVVEDNDFGDLINEVHVVNTTLEDHGWGPQLLCSVFAFSPIAGGASDPAGAAGGAKVAGTYLVYLYKRGTFYPFVPLPSAEKRDSERERLLNVTLATDLAIEPDLERWFPLWGLPVH
ncbi:MAG: hypothetical protein ABSG36_03345 [Acidimicrobiales bacterium]